MRRFHNGRTLIGVAILGLVIPGAYTTSHPVSASAATQEISYGPNGSINALLADGAGGAYVGGAFDGWGYQTGGLAAISGDRETGGAPDLTFPDVVGTVLAIEPDGEGGFFLGGNFDEVGGEDRVNLAHINESGDVTDWAPETDDSVFTLEVHDGLVFAGGRFFGVWDEATADFVDRSLAAAFDAETAELSTWNPGFSRDGSGGWFNLVNEGVWDIHILGTTLYVGGAFNELTWDSPATARSGIAAFDLTSLIDGSNGLTAFAPDPDGPVLTMATSPDSELLIGGIFENVGATPVPRMSLAEIAVATAEATAFDMPVVFDDGTTTYPGQVQAIAMSGDDILVGGGFDAVDGEPRQNLALVRAGVVDAWAPEPDGTVDALAVSGGSFYVAGSFSQIEGIPHEGVAKFHLLQFESSWNPAVDDSVSAVSVTDTGVLIGGRFDLVGTVPARQLVRVTSSGTLDDTFEAMSSMTTGFYDNEVTALAMWSGELAVARTAFDSTTDDPADSLEWLDPGSGAATSRLPFVPNGAIETLVAGARLYAGGSFTSVDPPGGAPAEARTYGFGVLSDGESLAAWAPAFAGPVNDLLVDGDFVYAVGEGPGTGAYLGGTPFAVRAETFEDGLLDNSWSVDLSRGGIAQYGQVFSIAAWAGGLAIGGRMLTSTGISDDGFSLLGVSAVDASITWQSGINGRSSVRVLMPRARSLILGGTGSFNSADTSAAPTSLAILDAPAPPTTRTSWSPDAESRVNAVVISGSNLFVGGSTRLLITPVPVDSPNGGGGGGGGGGDTPAPQTSGVAPTKTTPTQQAPAPNLDVRLRPGATAVFIAGRSVPLTAQAGSRNASVIVTGGGGVMTVPSPGGLGGDGAPQWRPGSSMSITATGFGPGSQVGAFLLSDPMSLGSVTVGSDGTATLPVTVPQGMVPGDHTLQVVGVNAQGQTRLVAIGLRVGEVSRTAGTQVTFAVGSTRLTPASRASLRSLVKQVDGVGVATVTGVTKHRPTADQSALARARARTVAQHMRQAGFTGLITTRIQATATSGTWRDRRVEVTVRFA